MSETILSSKNVFTTTDVAKICKVTPHIVDKWFDEGQLKGYLIPGSGRIRRIPRIYLTRFLKEHGMTWAKIDDNEPSKFARELNARVRRSFDGAQTIEDALAERDKVNDERLAELLAAVEEELSFLDEDDGLRLRAALAALRLEAKADTDVNLPAPKIITYANLLHKYLDPQAKEVLSFVEQNKHDKVFVGRARTLNKLYALMAPRREHLQRDKPSEYALEIAERLYRKQGFRAEHATIIDAAFDEMVLTSDKQLAEFLSAHIDGLTSDRAEWLLTGFRSHEREGG